METLRQRQVEEAARQQREGEEKMKKEKNENPPNQQTGGSSSSGGTRVPNMMMYHARRALAQDVDWDIVWAENYERVEEDEKNSRAEFARLMPQMISLMIEVGPYADMSHNLLFMIISLMRGLIALLIQMITINSERSG